MRWVVELPAPSGGTAATVTVESDSWAGALSSARGGVSIRKFRCEFENDGVVRVNDLEANERYTVRPYRASQVPPADAPAGAAPTGAAPLRGATIPPASGRPSRAPSSPGSGSFSVAPPPSTSVALPARNSAPPTSPIAADPVPDIDVPSPLSGTVITSAVPAAVDAPPAKAPEANAPVAPAVVDEKPKPVTDLGATVVDLPIFVASVASPPAPTEPVASVAAPTEPVARAPVEAKAPESEAHDSKIDSAHAASNGSNVEPTLVTNTLLFERDQDPSATNPLTYRERVYSVAAGTTVAQAEAVARHTLTSLKRSLATRPRGRYVTVAVFDHVFAVRPAESPLVVLRWKDWRSDLAELQVRPTLPAAAAVEATAKAVADVENAPAGALGEALVEAAPAIEQPSASVTKAPVAVEPAAAPAPAAVATPAPEPTAVVVPTVEAAVVVPVAPVEPAAPVGPAAPLEPVVAIVEPAAVVTAPAATTEPAPTPGAVEAPAPEATPSTIAAESVEVAAVPPADRESTGPEISTGPDVAVTAGDTAESGEHAAAVVAAEPTSEAGSRRKKRRGRRDSQPSLPGATTAPTATAPAPAPAPATPTIAPDRKRYSGGRRGPDLLSDLFDSVMELSFQHSGQEVCAFVASVLTQNLRCDAVLVFAYDINRDEFVVNGEANTGRLDQRVHAKAGSYGAAARLKRGVNLPAAKGDDRADPACEGGPALYVPALHHERLFALVQVARLPGSPPFEADELDATTYIAGQLAEALAHHSLRQTATEISEKKEAPVPASRRPR
jgi:hypothetical protein